MVTSKHPASRCFTLIELLVTLVVAAIVLTLGVPSFQSFIANQRARTAAQALFVDLTLARSEAVKRNNNVVVSAIDDSWANGWTITPSGVGVAAIRKQDSLPQIGASSATTTITFLRNGRVSGTTAPTVTFCDAAGSGAVTKRIIGLDLSGLPRITRGGSC